MPPGILRRPPWNPKYYLSADLGDRNDYTALVLGEAWTRNDAYQWDVFHPDDPPMLGATLARDFVTVVHSTLMASSSQVLRDPGALHALRIRHIERFRGLGYPEVQRRISALMARDPLTAAEGRPRATLLLDATGVGLPIRQLLAKTFPALIGITITGGMAVTRDPAHHQDFRVPKRQLVQAVSAIMEGDRLQIAPTLPESEHLKWELADFRVQTDEDTGYETFSARSGEHDDIVLALAMMAWHVLQPSRIATVFRPPR